MSIYIPAPDDYIGRQIGLRAVVSIIRGHRAVGILVIIIEDPVAVDVIIRRVWGIVSVHITVGGIFMARLNPIFLCDAAICIFSFDLQQGIIMIMMPFQ